MIADKDQPHSIRRALDALRSAHASIPDEAPNAQHARQCVVAAITALLTRAHPSADDVRPVDGDDDDPIPCGVA